MKIVSTQFVLTLVVLLCAVQYSSAQLGSLLGLGDLLGALLGLLGTLLGGLLGLVDDILRDRLLKISPTAVSELGPLLRAELTFDNRLDMIIRNMSKVSTSETELNNLAKGVVMSASRVRNDTKAYFNLIIASVTNNTFIYNVPTCRTTLNRAVSDYNNCTLMRNVNLTDNVLTKVMNDDIKKQGSCVPERDICVPNCTIVYDIRYDIEDITKYMSGIPALAYECYMKLRETVQSWSNCISKP